MKQIFAFLLISLFSCGSSLRADSSLPQQADSAYTTDNFKEAAEIYQHIINEEGSSAELLYNLGNCHYRMGEIGKAILAYERALRIDPTFEDAKINLEFVNEKIADRPGERGTFLGNALDAAANSAKSNTWAWMALICFSLALFGIIAYMFSSTVIIRKIGFFGGFTTILASGCLIYLAYRSANIAGADDIAIITSPSYTQHISSCTKGPHTRSNASTRRHKSHHT